MKINWADDDGDDDGEDRDGSRGQGPGTHGRWVTRVKMKATWGVTDMHSPLYVSFLHLEGGEGEREVRGQPPLLFLSLLRKDKRG